MASRSAFLIFVVLAIVPLTTLATEYIVGDGSGWTLGFDYQAWAHGKNFQVGDTLVFRYPAGAHNVFKVNGTAFQNCTVPPLHQALTTGNDTITLSTPGNKWYICGVGNHCKAGQKLVINVQSYTPAPAPAPSMAPYRQIGQDLPETEGYFTPAPSPGMTPPPIGSPYVQIGQELPETEECDTPAPSPGMVPPQSGAPYVQIGQEYTPAPSPGMIPPQSGTPYVQIGQEYTPAPSPGTAPYGEIGQDLPETPGMEPYVQIGHQIHETEEYSTPAPSPSITPSPLSSMPYVEYEAPAPSPGMAPSPVNGMPYTGASSMKRPFIKFF